MQKMHDDVQKCILLYQKMTSTILVSRGIAHCVDLASMALSHRVGKDYTKLDKISSYQEKEKTGS